MTSKICNFYDLQLCQIFNPKVHKCLNFIIDINHKIIDIKIAVERIFFF